MSPITTLIAVLTSITVVAYFHLALKAADEGRDTPSGVLISIIVALCTIAAASWSVATFAAFLFGL